MSSTHRPLRSRTNKLASGSFRPDVQGLRALAVVAVVLDHLAHWPSGGFIGVDVFFVISGFLITGLLLKEHGATGRISFRTFYVRRVKRIVPAATLVLLVTVLASYAIFNAGRSEQTLVDGVWSFFFSANWHFAAAGTDYFQATGPVSPLQHYWSLSVEEQFYFVWPLLLVLIFLVGSRTANWNAMKARIAAGIAMTAVIALSFSWAVFETSTNPTWAYFSTMSRAWELGVGALIAVSAGFYRRLPSWSRPILGWIGLAGILTAMFITPSTGGFPAPWALLGVLATGLVIIAGTGGQQRLLFPLVNPVAKWIGDVSFSMYLWHFPIITLASEFIAEPTPAFYLVVVGMILFMSSTSYYFIEKPVRNSSLFERRTPQEKARLRHANKIRSNQISKAAAWRGLGALALVTAALVAVAITPNQVDTSALPTTASAMEQDEPAPEVAATGADASLISELQSSDIATSWPTLDPSIDAVHDAKNPEIEGKSGCLNPVDLGNDSQCMFGTGDKLVVVIGDSFSTAWLPVFRGVFEPREYSVKGAAFSTCPFISADVALSGGEATSDRCNDSREGLVEMVNRLDPEVVIILDSEWSVTQLADKESGDSLTEAWSTSRAEQINLIKSENRRIILMQPNPAGADMTECATRISVPMSCRRGISSSWTAHVEGDEIAAAATQVETYDTRQWFSVGNNVMPFAGTAPQRWDASHLTPQYSAKLIAPLDALLFPSP